VIWEHPLGAGASVFRPGYCVIPVPGRSSAGAQPAPHDGETVHISIPRVTDATVTIHTADERLSLSYLCFIIVHVEQRQDTTTRHQRVRRHHPRSCFPGYRLKRPTATTVACASLGRGFAHTLLLGPSGGSDTSRLFQPFVCAGSDVGKWTRVFSVISLLQHQLCSQSRVFF
jgi:hypothetical protein